MKKSYLNSLFTKTALLAVLLSAQSYAQNAYTVESIPYQVYTASLPFEATQDDAYSEIISIPFDFSFFGNTYNQFVVSTNGYIDFRTELAGTNSTWIFNTAIPNPSFPAKNAILGCFHDMSNPTGVGTITSSISGNAPYRQFVLMFNNQPHFVCDTARSSFQIIIYETLNYIDIQITQKDICSTWYNGNAVTGIIDATGSIGYAPPGRNTGAWTVTTGEGWRFKPTESILYKYIKCDTNNDGIESFDLNVIQNDLNSSAAFYLTMADATQAINPIAGTQYNNSTPNPQTIYAAYNNQIIPVQLSTIDCTLDSDLDSVATSSEDANNDGNLANDDTDGDGIPNFIDNDDDGDLIPTSEEYIFTLGRTSTDSTNGGNETPTDTDSDGIPNYLDNDDDGDGILTINEDYDHNGDPSDDDSNNNGIPDYLETTTTGTSDNSFKNAIKFYPNPASDILNIENNTGEEITDISVYSISGIRVKQTVNSNAIQVSDLQSGIYLIKVKVDDQTLNYKFVKK